MLNPKCQQKLHAIVYPHFLGLHSELSHSPTWLKMLPKHYCWHLRSSVFYWFPDSPHLCSNLEHTLGTISFGVSSCSCLWMVSFSHYRQLILSLTFQETHSGILSEIQIRKLCRSQLLFSPKFEKKSLSNYPSHIYPFKTPSVVIILPNSLLLCLFGAKVARKLKHDIFREKHYLRHKENFFPEHLAHTSALLALVVMNV